MIIRKRIRGRAVMPHLYDAPRFQEYHPSSDELVGRELQLDPLNTRYKLKLRIDNMKRHAPGRTLFRRT